MPSGAFYLFVDMRAFLAKSKYETDEAFVLDFLDKHFRISCAASLEQLTEAMNRLEKFINE